MAEKEDVVGLLARARSRVGRKGAMVLWLLAAIESAADGQVYPVVFDDDQKIEMAATIPGATEILDPHLQRFSPTRGG